jgi:hypothetical protein
MEEKMIKKPLARVLLGLAVLTLVGVTALALGSKDGIITINGGTMTVAMRGPSKFFTPTAKHDPKLKTIYSNLGTGSSAYNCCVGWTISATGSVVGSENWVANAFTPAANATIVQIDLGVGYVTGTNSVEVAIATDNGGKPGRFLDNWDLGNLPTFGTCCTLITVKDGDEGIAVKANTQYWLVVKTDAKKSPDTWNAWNLDNSATGQLANNTGTGWTNRGVSQQGAFDLLGR